MAKGDDARDARLAEALRRNLRLRKGQARARLAGDGTPETTEAGDATTEDRRQSDA